MIIAATERLIIRSWEKDDVEQYFKIIADEEVMKFINGGKALSRKDAEAYVYACISNFENYGWSRFVVEIKETKEFAGFCGFKFFNNELDFGWQFAKSFWGKGIGSEAAQAVLELGLHQFKFKRIVCIVYPQNIPSIKIIEKLNFQFEKNIVLNDKELLQYSFMNL